MIYSPPVFHRDLHVVSESMMNLEGYDTVRYQNLSESARTKAASKLVNFVFKRIESGWDSDPAIGRIMKTKGSVSSIREHEIFESALSEYKSLTQRNRSFAAKYASQLTTLNEFLRANENDFNRAFHEDNRIVMFYYSSLVALMYQSFAYILSITVNQSANGNAALGMFDSQENLTNSILITNLEKLTEQITTGQAKEFIANSLGEGNINEDFGLTGFLLASAGIVAATLWFMRDLIEYILIFRNRISDWFASYASFLELRNSNLRQTNKAAADKQLKLAKKFNDLAEKIKVENQTANKTAIKNIEAQDAKIDLNTLNSGGFDSVNSQYLI